ncbi:MAG: acylphosphatase [Patescibacteria group bacterium]|jgi:acylphosphatase
MAESWRILVFGLVQGVGLRYQVRQYALDKTLKGYAKNLPDKSVEIIIVGEEEKIQDFIGWLNNGINIAKIKKIEAKKIQSTRQFDRFEILY